MSDNDGHFVPFLSLTQENCPANNMDKQNSYILLLASYLGGSPLPTDYNANIGWFTDGIAKAHWKRVAMDVWVCPECQRERYGACYAMNKSFAIAGDGSASWWIDKQFLPLKPLKSSQLRKNAIHMSDDAAGATHQPSGGAKIQSFDYQRSGMQHATNGPIIMNSSHPGIKWNYLFSDASVRNMSYLATGTSASNDPLWQIQ